MAVQIIGIDLASGPDRTAYRPHSTCGDGPVIEEHDGGKVRIACCYCWKQTQYYATAEQAWRVWKKRHDQKSPVI